MRDLSESLQKCFELLSGEPGDVRVGFVKELLSFKVNIQILNYLRNVLISCAMKDHLFLLSVLLRIVEKNISNKNPKVTKESDLRSLKHFIHRQQEHKIFSPKNSLPSHASIVN